MSIRMLSEFVTIFRADRNCYLSEAGSGDEILLMIAAVAVDSLPESGESTKDHLYFLSCSGETEKLSLQLISLLLLKSAHPAFYYQTTRSEPHQNWKT